ncbi:hypothetical protein PM082_019335 [Marasmius tenuissimus]|nr:hypothetical protein PM082_019335 [Marasmius tenuissimus]
MQLQLPVSDQSVHCPATSISDVYAYVNLELTKEATIDFKRSRALTIDELPLQFVRFLEGGRDLTMKFG